MENLRHTQGFAGWLDKFFSISARRSTIRREVVGGLVTFFSMAYILIVNPLMLSGIDGGINEIPGITTMNFDSIFMATALAAALTTILMGVFAKLPLALAPGMGLNAFFTYNVAYFGMGLGWEKALAVVFVSGVLFLAISATGVRSKALNAIPKSIKAAMGAGIGFFIAFIGFKNAGIVQSNGATFVSIGDLTDPGVILGLAGIIIMIILFFLKVKGYMIIALISTLAIGIIMKQAGLTSNDAFALPDLGGLQNGWGGNWGSLNDTFGKAFGQVGNVIATTSGWIAIIVFLFVDFFDTAGTIVAAGTEAGLLSIDGNVENAEKALMVDAIGTIGGSILGTSTITTFVESNTGIAQGARTGLSSVVVGLLFFISIFISPIFGLFTGATTALALVGVGMLMISHLKDIDWEDKVITFTSFIIIILMVLTFAVYWGIVFGFIIYTISMIASKRHKEVQPAMYGLTVLSIMFIVFEVLANR